MLNIFWDCKEAVFFPKRKKSQISTSGVWPLCMCHFTHRRKPFLGWVEMCNFSTERLVAIPPSCVERGSDRAINIVKTSGATLKLATFWGWLIILKPNIVYCLFTSADSPVSPKICTRQNCRSQTCLARMLSFSTSHASSLCEEASYWTMGDFKCVGRLFCEGRWPISFSALFYGKQKKQHGC